MLKYLIHNLIEVDIAPNLNKLVIEGIDFQIGYFKVQKDYYYNAPYSITVKPYHDFKYDIEENQQHFHLIKGKMGTYIDDKKNKIAIKKTSKGFQIFTQRDFLITLFIQLILFENNIMFVHAAAVSDKNGNVLLLPGPGGVGKTALLGMLVKNKKYKILGDDIVAISEKGICYAFPRSFVLKKYHRETYPHIFKKIEKNIFISIIYTIKKHAVFIKDKDLTVIDLMKKILYLSYRTLQLRDSLVVSSIPVKDIFGNDCVVLTGKLSKIVFMERYGGKKFTIDNISVKSLRNKMFSIILHEWIDSMRQLFSLGAMELIDLPDYFTKTQNILKIAISTKQIRKLMIPDGSSPQELYQYFLEQMFEKN